MSKSLMPTVVITGLTTAVLMLGYQYMTTTNALNSQIEEKDEAISRLNAEMLSSTSSLIAGAEPEAITTPATPATPAASASAPEGSSPHTGEQWIYGNARARFTLLELTDTECPYCREHFPVLRGLIEASGGNINGALLHVPVQGEASRRQAVAIECAGEQGGSEAAWAMMDTILNTTRGNGQGMEKPTAVLAGGMGLDQQRFIACTESVEVIDRITADLDVAMKLGIAQTPSTLVYDNTTGASILLQGSHASAEGIVDAIETLTLNQEG